MMDNKTWVVIAGTVFSGMEFFGPFDAPDDAVKWASFELDGSEWQVCELQPPVADTDYTID